MMQELVEDEKPILPEDLPDEAVEDLVWYLFAETLRDAVKIGEKKAAHFRNNVGGAGIKNDRPHKGAIARWNSSKAEKALKEATERLDAFLETSLFRGILESLGRPVAESTQYFREIMRGEHINAATKGLNQIKKRRQMRAKEKKNA